MKKNSLSLVFMLVIATMLISACGALAAVNPGTAVNSVKPAPTHVLSTPVPLPTGPAADLLSAYQGTLEQIYAAVSPSVVNIRVVAQVAAAGPGPANIPGFPFFNAPQGGQPQQQFQAALGSGFVWDQQGHIVTNNHVVAGADKIEVTFSDGTIVPAKLVGADPDSDLRS